MEIEIAQQAAEKIKAVMHVNDRLYFVGEEWWDPFPATTTASVEVDLRLIVAPDRYPLSKQSPYTVKCQTMIGVIWTTEEINQAYPEPIQLTLAAAHGGLQLTTADQMTEGVQLLRVEQHTAKGSASWED